MLRRSIRLMTNCYYNSAGERTISYKETTYRFLKKRKAAPHQAKPKPDISHLDLFDPKPEPDVSHLNFFDPEPELDVSQLDVFDPEPETTPNKPSEIGSPKRTLRMFLLVVLFFCFGLFLTLAFPTEFATAVVRKVFTGSSENIIKELKDLREELKELKEKMQLLYPDDKNFALEALGARIIYEKTSAPYSPQEPERHPPVSPRILLQDWAPMVPTKCWAFEGSKGQLSVQLSNTIVISHVSIGHISKNVSPNDDISSAPRLFSVFGKQNLEDPDMYLGTFEYLAGGRPLQTFEIAADNRNVVKHLSLRIHSNWGNLQYSCMYRLRVHGELALNMY